jgi:hypothetical protein
VGSIQKKIHCPKSDPKRRSYSQTPSVNLPISHSKMRSFIELDNLVVDPVPTAISTKAESDMALTIMEENYNPVPEKTTYDMNLPFATKIPLLSEGDMQILQIILDSGRDWMNETFLSHLKEILGKQRDWKSIEINQLRDYLLKMKNRDIRSGLVTSSWDLITEVSKNVVATKKTWKG